MTTSPDPHAPHPLAAQRFAATRRPTDGRVVAVHGFTQTSACWSPIDAAPGPAPRPGAGRRPGPRRLGRRRARPVGRAAAPWPRPAAPGPTWATRWAGASACTPRWPDPMPVERLVLISATGGIDDAGDRAERRAADEQLADHVLAVGRGGLRGRVAGPAAVRRPDRRSGPPPGPTGQHRRRPGLQPAPGRHRHPGAAVGPPGRADHAGAGGGRPARRQVRGAGRAAGRRPSVATPSWP